MPEHVQYHSTIDEEKCREIAEASFRILADTGCVVHNAEARRLLVENGCSADSETVRIPAEVTRKAIASAPSTVTLYNRVGEPAMTLAPGNVYFGPAITITGIADPKTGKVRPAVLSDCKNAATVMDALDNISWASALVSPSDVPSEVSDLKELYSVLTSTDKPVMYWAQSTENLGAEFEMFEAIAGNEERLRERPFMIDLVCPMDPLTHTDDGLAQILYLARHSAPAVYIAGIGMGLTGPATIAGTVALGIADTLVGLIVSQLACPGAPFVASKFTDNVDMRTMSVTHSNPEMLLANMVTADVFRYLDLPFCLNFGGTDSGQADQVSAFDKGVQIYAALLSGTNMNFALGAYESGVCARLEDLVLSNEMASFLEKMVAPVEVSEETLAEDVIDEVGPGGSFLTEEHTLDHLYDFWQADILYPRTNDLDKDRNRISPAKGAENRVEEILAKGSAHPLSEEITQKLDAIIEKKMP